jgi:hypothetical protein
MPFVPQSSWYESTAGRVHPSAKKVAPKVQACSSQVKRRV